VSGKKRRQQLKEKRARKERSPRNPNNNSRNGDNKSGGAGAGEAKAESKPRLVTSFGGKAGGGDTKLATYFVRESDENVKIRRRRGSLPLQPQPCRLSRAQPVADAQLAVLDPVFSHPMRPRWSQGETKEVIERRETIMFRAWCKRVHTAAAAAAAAAAVEAAGRKEDGGDGELGDEDESKAKVTATKDGLGERVTPFEHNLEVWRQLWRVVEFSDVLLLVADARYPLFHIPPSLVREITAVRHKGMVIVLNKVDLVTEEHVRRWRDYLERQYPGVVVAEFSARPCLDEELRGRGGVNSRRKRLHQRVRRDLLSRHLDQHASGVIAAAVRATLTGVSPRESGDKKGSSRVVGEGGARGEEGEEERKITIGLVGHPNVGKTSVLNALVGRKAASTSRTAGHTKHLQHIPLPQGSYPHLPRDANAYVLDCPGLVFPRQAPRHLVEVMGLYPIAQIRETLSAVRYLAERIPVEQLYALRKHDYVESTDPWTPQLIVEAYAERKGYFTGRGGAPDVHRGGLEIVRDAVDGALLLAFDPPPVDAAKAAVGGSGSGLVRHVLTPYGAGVLISSSAERSECSTGGGTGGINGVGGSEPAGGVGAAASAPAPPAAAAVSAVVELDWGGYGYFRAPEVVRKVTGSANA